MKYDQVLITETYLTMISKCVQKMTFKSRFFVKIDLRKYFLRYAAYRMPHTVCVLVGPVKINIRNRYYINYTDKLNDFLKNLTSRNFYHSKRPSEAREILPAALIQM